MSARKFRLPLLVAVAAGLAIFAWNAAPPSDQRSEAADLPKAYAAAEPAGPGSISITRIRAAERPAGKDEDVNPLARLKRERLHETVARPLFSPSRRPPPPPAKVKQIVTKAPAARPSLNHFALVGVIMGGSKSVALLRHKGNGQNIRVTEGESFAGWQLRRVTSSSVTLAGRTATVTLPLFKQ